MEYKEAYDILWSWEWDVKQAAHELVQALMSKPDRETHEYWRLIVEQ